MRRSEQRSTATEDATGVSFLQNLASKARTETRTPFGSLDINSPIKLRPRSLAAKTESRAPFGSLDINSPIKLRPRSSPLFREEPARKRLRSLFEPVKPVRTFITSKYSESPRNERKCDDKENAPLPPRCKTTAPVVVVEAAPVKTETYEPTEEETEFLRQLFRQPAKRDSERTRGERPKPAARRNRPTGDDLSSTSQRHFPLPSGPFGFGETEEGEGIFACNHRWKAQFPLWDRYIFFGFHLVLWGWGSKVPLLEQFYRRPEISGASYSLVVVPGYLPDCHGHRIMDAVCEYVACRTGLPVPVPQLKLDFISDHIEEAATKSSATSPQVVAPRIGRGGIFTHISARQEAPLLLVFYTFDQPAFREDQVLQRLLEIIANCRGVRLVLTVDMAPNPEHLLFPPALHNIPLVPLHTPTFVSYKHLEAAEQCRERPFAIPGGALPRFASSSDPKVPSTNLRGLDEVVACNTTVQTRKVLRIALDYWKERKEDISLAELLSRSTRILAAHDERGLLHQLQECLDHDVVSIVPGPTGDRMVHLIQPEQLEKSLIARNS
eukprot:TRINITY_DN12708_c0_g1_i1.p1 TRINITY_DN12708_c0_g1~~TRINITY_DN12708_c0_g1_i1.p1  ORF type:complete len:564 (+),score=81.81 TRINITY_DN12708_c0_g1_i1:34-1692(+)